MLACVDLNYSATVHIFDRMALSRRFLRRCCSFWKNRVKPFPFSKSLLWFASSQIYCLCLPICGFLTKLWQQLSLVSSSMLNLPICVHYPDPQVILQYIQYSRFSQKFKLALLSALFAIYSLTFAEVALLDSNLLQRLLLPPCAFIRPIEESFLPFVFFWGPWRYANTAVGLFCLLCLADAAGGLPFFVARARFYLWLLRSILRLLYKFILVFQFFSCFCFCCFCRKRGRRFGSFGRGVESQRKRCWMRRTVHLVAESSWCWCCPVALSFTLSDSTFKTSFCLFSLLWFLNLSNMESLAGKFFRSGRLSYALLLGSRER